MKANHTVSAKELTAAAEAACAAATAAVAAIRAVTMDQEESSPATARLPFAEPPFPKPAPFGKRRKTAVIHLRRVHFNCPACCRFTVLPVAHCGHLVSCPKCFTGIRVPDPRQKIAAENLGRTLEPMLHPQRFVPSTDAHRLLPWLMGRLPTPAQALVALGAVLLLAGTTTMTPLTLHWAGAQQRLAALAAPASARPVAYRSLATEAEDAVRNFLTAETPEAKSAWVVDASRSTPLMADWYERRPGGGRQAQAVVGASSQGFYATPGDPMNISEVPVEVPGQAPMTYLVEHRPEGPRIAWAESVGYSPIDWNELVKKTDRQEPVRLRLLACLDDYYNYAFSAEAKFCCVRLHDPLTMELLGFGYVPRTEGVEEALALSLPPAAATTLLPVTVAVQPRENSADTRQVAIVGKVVSGWKAHPSASPAVDSPRLAFRSTPAPLVPDR